jgi:hypothetical protein
MDEEGGFVTALERGNGGGDLQFPVSLFISPDGYLYCYHIGSMSDREIAYRVDGFMKDSTATPAPSATPRSRR